MKRLALPLLFAAIVAPAPVLAQDIPGEFSFDFAAGTDNADNDLSAHADLPSQFENLKFLNNF